MTQNIRFGEGIRVLHEGPAVQSVEDRADYAHRITLECSKGLPAATRIRLVMGDFRLLLKKMDHWCMNLQQMELDGEGEVVVNRTFQPGFYAGTRQTGAGRNSYEADA
ncbi:hypothetical protein [Paenibacillus roseipurpureus]|uniref:Uncharacterized protein n=1 Tax=Paenibacillus roseopurpureus TaxID=2918901 RepID=A0AA96LKB5_9BACL|nr:hypothetical protein [Paenibacillus sp. MBLB1832]WNR43487.1 hypothetical protein MJB10_20610 [Paenibacillus sp. MBLB1832]